MITLTSSDLKFIIGALNNAANEYAGYVNSTQASGLKRIYAMQMERSKTLADTLQAALDKSAKRIAVK